jgi:lipopolysaccharide transport system permease protein
MLRHYIQLVAVKVAANLKAEASRHYLNYLWWIFEPMLQMLVFYVVFGLLLQRGTENFVAYLLTGLIPWLWFNRTIANSMLSIVAGRGLMMQVHLPKIILPTIVIFQDLVKQGLVLIVLLIFLIAYGIPPSVYWLCLPFILITQMALICAMAFAVAAVIPFLPDLKFLVRVGLQMMMFCSGVFYSTAIIPAEYKRLFFMNPMANLLNNYRRIFLYAQPPDWQSLFIISAVSLIIIYVMFLIYKKLDHIYPRVLI